MTRWSEILEGALFPAVPVPFNESKPDFQAQEKYASWMATQDIDGVAVWSHIGRGLHLDKTTRAEVLKCWKKALGAGRKIIAGVGPSLDSSRDSFISSAMKMAEDAEDADFLLVFPPSGFIEQSNPDGMIVNYHKELAKSGKPLILFYLSPRIGGMEYSTDVLDELLSMPEVAGIKMATLDSPILLQDTVTHILINHPDKAILTGEDRLYGYSLYRGCHGALIGMGAAFVDLQREMIDSWFIRELHEFLVLSSFVDYLAEVIFIEPLSGCTGRILYMLAYLGLIPESSSHDPFAPQITQVEKEFIKATVDKVRERLDASD